MALTGQHLIVASIPEASEPAVTRCALEVGKAGNWSPRTPAIDRQCHYPGLSIEYFLWLSSILNFTFEVRTPSEGSYGKPLGDNNGSYWDGVIGMLANGTADVSFHPLFMTGERATVITYGPPCYLRAMYGFIYKTPAKLGMFSAFYPLNWTIYLIVCAAFFLCFSFALLFSLTRPRPSGNVKTVVELVWTMLELDAALLKRRFRFKPGLVLFAWFLTVYTVTNAYRSNLIVSAISRLGHLPLANLQDAEKLLKSDRLRLVVPEENLQEFYDVLEGLPGVNREYESWARLLRDYRPLTARDWRQMADYLGREEYAFFGDVREVAWMFQKDSSSTSGRKKFADLGVTFVRTPQGGDNGALGFRRGFPFMEQFTASMLDMMSDSVVHRMSKGYVDDQLEKSGFDSDTHRAGASTRSELGSSRKNGEIAALDFEQLLNLFCVWSIGCGVAAVIFGLEYAKARWMERTRVTRL